MMFVNQVLSCDRLTILSFEPSTRIRVSPGVARGFVEIDIKTLVRLTVGHSLHSRNQEPSGLGARFQSPIRLADFFGRGVGWVTVWLRLGCDRGSKTFLRGVFPPHPRISTGLGHELRTARLPVWSSIRGCSQ